MSAKSFKRALMFSLVFVSLSVAAQKRQKDMVTYNIDPNKKTYFLQDTVKRPWLAAVEVVGLNVLVNRFNYYARPETDFSEVGINTWIANFKHGLEWDWNNFGVNYIGHPYQGSHYYNSARSVGYNYWASGIFTFAGSATWEWMGETHPPSGNDLVNTTMGGMFLGEVMYRFSDMIYDGKARGFGRVTREFFAFLLNPMRGFNRMNTGKFKEYELGEGFVKPPFEGSVSFGGNQTSELLNGGTQYSSALLETKLVYGTPFEDRFEKKKPFDYFVLEGWYRVRNDNDTGKTRHISLSGYGSIWMKEITGEDEYGVKNENRHAAGLFHQYDYLDGGIVEIGSMALTPGIISDFKLSKKFKMRTTLMAGPIVLGGSNSEVVDASLFSDDPTDVRDYIMGPGITEKYELLLDGGKWGIFDFKFHRWDIFVASGPAGRERLNALFFDYEFPIYKKLYLGARYVYYDRKAVYDDFPDIEKNLDEIRTFVTLHF